jgi:PKD repeat protein
VAGTYTVALKVVDDSGAVSFDSATAVIGEGDSQVPVAEAGGPYTGTVGVQVSVDGSGSSDSDGTIALYHWDFGDGNAASSSRPTAGNTYALSGDYTVTLTVVDNNGERATDTTTATISAGNQPPVADAGPTVMGARGMVVDFDGSASTDPDGMIVQYDWDFGDNSTPALDAGQTPSHTYAVAGDYTVVLTVTDNGGETDSDSTIASIASTGMVPTAEAGGPYSGTAGVPVSFDGSGSNDSDGDLVAWNWDFGDGNVGSGPTVSHTYSAGGQYDVILTVTDDTGDIDTDTTTADIGGDGQPPVMGEVSKVVAEGETLRDGTVLQQILLEGGVAINTSGKVAFGGRPDTDSAPGVFTQEGLVVQEGQTLPNGTVVNDLSPFGEVAIGVSQDGDVVAFHGQAETGLNDTDAVFTQGGLVAVEGAPLPDGTILNNIKPEGKVAINDFGEVAFHGKLEVEGEGIDTEEFRAVFTQAGVAAKEGDTLSDSTIVNTIDETGEVAINEFGLVAFHGEVVDPSTGPDALPAVFTQEGVVVKTSDALPDGTIVEEIDENGGVAMNFFGHVAFHGDVVIPDAGTDTVPAVFTQEGLVVKEGQTLPDGTIVEEINQSGGVGINFFGDVVFHGRTGGVKAVFTQKGLVAKEGGTLADGTTTLDEILDSAGVAINLLGEVAFHGKLGTTDAVFLGTAP